MENIQREDIQKEKYSESAKTCYIMTKYLEKVSYVSMKHR